jgi:2-dehydro-3-deoxyphosphogluconate aldolase/(4S)-4-hydroxy-2-oxoglutarate aldolase
MDMDAFYDRLEHAGYIPQTYSDKVHDGAALAHALVGGGLTVVQVECMGTSGAKVIHDMATAEPDLLVGAGAIVTTDALATAIESGAGFVTLPTYDEALCHACVDADIPCIPTTVDEGGIFKAHKMGLTVTGMVTANPQDAISCIDRFAAAFEGHRFMPIGSVDEDNTADFLADPAVLACCSEDWVTRPDFVEGGEYEGITRLAAEANACVRRARK